MVILSATLGVVLILVILGDAFETIVFPRRVTRRIRLARFFIRYTWLLWVALVHWLSSRRRQETYLSFFGPLALLLLLVVWAAGLIFGFAILHWASGSTIQPGGGNPGFATDLYFSATTFFTLGLGDVIPRTPMAKALTAVQAGVGFGFLALVIGFLPAINQSFSRREVNISLLDARAGSPPTAAEVLRRHGYDHGLEALQMLLRDWEGWSAELLESHLSYPMLAFFRSQHDNQSWLGALTAILDTCALIMAGLEGACERQAELTFAIARHTVVDLSIIFRRPPFPPENDRLPLAQLENLRRALAASGLRLREGGGASQKLIELRKTYEPYVYSLAKYLHIKIPGWMPGTGPADNWQTSVWGPASGSPGADRLKIKKEEHF